MKPKQILRFFLWILVISHFTIDISFGQGNDKWLQLDDKLEMVMNESADEIDGDPIGSASAQRYNQMSQDALAWKYDFTNFSDYLDDDHWINAGVFDTEENAITWWEEQGLDNNYGNPTGDTLNFQQTDFNFDGITATLSGYGINGVWVEGQLSWRIGQFVFQVGSILRPSLNLLKETLKKDGTIMLKYAEMHDLFGDPQEIADFIIDFGDEERPVNQYQKRGFRFEALDAEGNRATNFNTSAVITAKNSDGNDINISPGGVLFQNGTAYQPIEFAGVGQDITLTISYLSTTKSTNPFEVRPDINIEITGFEGDLTYDSQIILHTFVEINDGSEMVPFAGTGSAVFYTSLSLGSFDNSGITSFTGSNISIRYHTPSKEVGEIKELHFIINMTVSPWTSYGGSERYTFPGGADDDQGFIYDITVGGPEHDEIVSTTIGESPGIVYVFGEYRMTAEFGDFSVSSDEGGDKMFLAKYNDADLDESTYFEFGSEAENDKPVKTVEDLGTTVLYFNSGGDIDLGSELIGRPPGSHVAVGKVNNEGELKWQSVSVPGSGSLTKSEPNETRHYGTDVVVDSEGNTYITGYFYDQITFHGADGISQWTAEGRSEEMDLFLVKFSPLGEVLWGFHANGEKEVEGQAICTDSHGNVYLGGQFESGMVFGSYVLEGGYEGFIIKFSSAGEILWVREIDGYANIKSMQISQSQDYIYLAGRGLDHTVFIGMPWEHPDESYAHNFIAKMTTDGDPVFIKFGDTDNEDAHHFVNDMTLDQHDNIYITGSFYEGTYTYDGITLSPQIVTEPNTSLIFVFAFDADGNALWGKMAGDNAGRLKETSTRGSEIKTDSNGNCYVVGKFQGEIRFGSLLLQSAGKTDGYMVKINTGTSGLEEMVFEDLTPQPANLLQNYPNPFNQSTLIKYEIFRPGKVSVSVINILGETIDVLSEKEVQPGSYEFDYYATHLQPGIYFIQLKMGYKRIIKKMIKF